MGGGVEFKWMRLEPEEVGKTLRVVEMETNAGQRDDDGGAGRGGWDGNKH